MKKNSHAKLIKEKEEILKVTYGTRIVNNVGDYNNLQEMKMEWKKKKKKSEIWIEDLEDMYLRKFGGSVAWFSSLTLTR